MKAQIIAVISVLGFFLFYQKLACNNKEEKVSKNIDNNVWVDPLIQTSSEDYINITVWFNDQFLNSNIDFILKQNNFRKRSSMRSEVMSRLKKISVNSKNQSKESIDYLIKTKKISDVKFYWIFNGFKAKIKRVELNSILSSIPNIKKVFYRPIMPVLNTGNEQKSISKPKTSFSKRSIYKNNRVWIIDSLNVYKVWDKLEIFGQGTLNAVHDFGFEFSSEILMGNIYQNQNEIPNNNVDDDLNGFIDDYNGYNFDNDSHNLTNTTKNRINHGVNCAALISGRISNNTIVGIAPKSEWVPIIGINNFEKAVEWSIENNIDTYSMSFSIPNLGEYKSHWRKVIEQGTYCGIFFVSGAGNFANKNNPRFAEVPFQMRIPEGIPNAVFGVSGVNDQKIRPVFSSKGPVLWQTEYYTDGLVNKPDFSTFNVLGFGINNNGQLEDMKLNGNSFAGPQMAGILSLMISANPELLPWEAKMILIESSRDILNPGYDFESGAGLIDAYQAVLKTINSKG